MDVLLSTAYFPPISWLAYVVQSDNWTLEAFEHFQKQSYRSRMNIHGPSGVQTLSVPAGRKVKEIQSTPISYQENWVQDHLRAIETAYANAPFFEVLFEDVRALLEQRYSTLWELNKATIALYLDWLELPLDIPITEEFKVDVHANDRRSLHPKESEDCIFPEYHQVFKHKNGFIHNLSALDLFFNLGRSSWDYLNELVLEQPNMNTEDHNEPILQPKRGRA